MTRESKAAARKIRESTPEARRKHAADIKAWRIKNPDKQRAIDTRYRASHKEQLTVWYAANARKRKYGITTEAFDALLLAQNSRCAMCGEELPANRSKISVDHDHTTGLFRGLLCIGCNVGLGRYELYRERAERYLATVRVRS